VLTDPIPEQPAPLFIFLYYLHSSGTSSTLADPLVLGLPSLDHPFYHPKHSSSLSHISKQLEQISPLTLFRVTTQVAATALSCTSMFDYERKMILLLSTTREDQDY